MYKVVMNIKCFEDFKDIYQKLSRVFYVEMSNRKYDTPAVSWLHADGGSSSDGNFSSDVPPHGGDPGSVGGVTGLNVRVRVFGHRAAHLHDPLSLSQPPLACGC